MKVVFLFLCVVLGRPALGQEKLENLLGLLSAAEPEYAVDGLLRLVEREVAPKKRHPELLEQAWQLATLAQQSVDRRAWWNNDDVLSGVLGNAAFARIDGLSLQDRVVEAWYRKDPFAAREYFERMVYPSLSSTPCEADLVPSFKRHYRLVQLLADRSFRPEERAKARHVAFVESRFRRMVSPAEVGPAIQTAVDGAFDQSSRSRLIGVIALQIPSLMVDFPAFTTHAPELFDIHQKMLATLPAGDSAALSMAQALRGLVIAQLSGTRCERKPEETGKRSSAGRILEQFHELVLKRHPNGAIEPIQEREITLRMYRPEKARVRTFSSAEALDLHRRVESLRKTAPRVASAVKEWDLEFHAVITALLERKPPEGNARAVFTESVWLLQGLGAIRLDPKKPYEPYEHEGRGRIPIALAGLLTGSLGSEVRRQDRNLWYWAAVETLDSSVLLPPKQQAALYEAIRMSGDPYLLFQVAFGEAGKGPRVVPPYLQ